MLKILRNPLYIYVLGFSLAFLIYMLGWSDLYPDISFEMKLFFSVAFISCLVAGFLIDRLKLIRQTESRTKFQLVFKGFIILLFFYTLEFFLEKDIPMLSKLAGRAGVNYMEFGIPLLHGILISFNSFLIAHTFTCYLSSKDRRFLHYNLMLYVPAFLFISRSIIVLGVLTSIFIYLHYARRIRLATFIKLGVLALAGIYLFGVIGNLRSGGSYFYVQSQATEEFMESSIPKEFYWTYLYASSPLANFQNTVNKKVVEEPNVAGFIFYENLPQIISKNLGDFLGVEHRDLVRIVPWLTVGTTYAKSYSYLGWLGPYTLFIINLSIYLLIILFLVPRRSSYHVTAIAILSVIILMNIFSNMLVVTGISFQLAYCILFAFLENKKFVLRS